MTELAIIRGRLANMGGTPTLQQCFYALGFEWGSARPTRSRRRKFSGRVIRNQDSANKILFCDSVTASAVLYDCHQHVKRLALANHPDKGGDGRLMAQINDAWGRIKMLFKRKGVTL